MAQSQASVLKLYRSVIEDVITGVRDSFLDEGVDEQVLQELKQIWETKLISSKAVELNPDPPEPQPPQLIQKDGGRMNVAAKSVHLGNQTNIFAQHQMSVQHQTIVHQSQGSLTNSQQHGQPQQQHTQQQLAPALPPAAPSQPTVIMADPNKQVPIQITLPAQSGGDSQPRVLTIQVPASALQGNQLHSVLTGPLISATMALPPHLASTLLQQHVTAALQGQAASTSVHLQPASTPERQTFQSGAIRQLDGAIDLLDEDTSIPKSHTSKSNVGHRHESVLGTSSEDTRKTGCRMPRTVHQLDGQQDTSDEDEDEDDDEDLDDDDENEEKDEEENEEENNGGQEEEPLNSEDDVSDEDPTDLFDTDNVVVCQYDKITRSRNKWKFYLKDGIMNLNGKDFVFQKASGDAEW